MACVHLVNVKIAIATGTLKVAGYVTTVRRVRGNTQGYFEEQPGCTRTGWSAGVHQNGVGRPNKHKRGRVVP